MPKKKIVSAEATGGAGTLFEYRIAAIMLTHLLRGTHPPGLPVPIAALALQQRVRGHLLDDIVVYGRQLPVALYTEFQVKTSLTVSPRNHDFIDVITQALHVLDENAQGVALGDICLGIVAKPKGDLEQLSKLASRAAAHASERTFFESSVKGAFAEKYRERLNKIRDAVTIAQARGAPTLGGVHAATHAFLHNLHVWCPLVEEGERDLQEALDRITPIAESFDVTSRSLFGDLADLAKTWGRMAGVVDADTVLRHLRRRGLKPRSAEVSSASSHDIEVDAIVRGPLDSLDLRASEVEAKRLLKAGDNRAAVHYAELSERLRSANFTPHAELMKRREAEALRACGEVEAAVRLSVSLAWDHLDRVQPWEAGFALLDRADHEGNRISFTQESRRLLDVVDAAVWVAKGSDLASYVPKFDALATGDHDELRAAVFLCEEAIADGQPNLVLERLDPLRAIVDRSVAPGGSRVKELAVRVRMCLADATGEWGDLVREMHRLLPRRMIAWLYARNARYLALSGDGPNSQHFYLEAIERASAEKMFDEAADWLYALRTVRFWFDTSHDDPQHSIAQALRPHARPSTLPGSPHVSELALRAAQDDTTPGEGLRQVQRWRWQAVVRAQITSELEAEKVLGSLLENQGDAVQATGCYIRSGAAKRAAAAARSFPEQPAHVPAAPHNAVPTSRAAAYAASATVSDLLKDDDARWWADKALDEISLDPISFPSIEPSPYVHAFDVLQAVADVLNGRQAERLLQQLELLLSEPSGWFRGIDKQVAHILISLAELGYEQAISLLIPPLLTDERMGEFIWTDIARAKRHAELLSRLLSHSISKSLPACLAIIRAGADPAPTLALARTVVERQLSPTEPGETDGNSIHWNAPTDATLATVLDQETKNDFAVTLLDRALNQRKSYRNRDRDIRALHILSSHVDTQTKRLCLSRLLDLARGRYCDRPVKQHEENTLPIMALRCAAMLDPDPDQSAEIEHIALTTLGAEGVNVQWHIGKAIARLPTAHSTLHPQQSATHPYPALRALAAYRWGDSPALLPHEIALQLATDKNPSVRRELATALMRAPILDPGRLEIVELLRSDPRRSVRTRLSQEPLM
ncbi:hypothetical protein ABGB17_17425 [Sphaerisporangium sp. B11E5]|uniref:hypothetical protein n=1 Tax=Sphaerisporangium sp. B11E5 TaxID=3153563 RepID=UPI00325C7D25